MHDVTVVQLNKDVAGVKGTGPHAFFRGTANLHAEDRPQPPGWRPKDPMDVKYVFEVLHDMYVAVHKAKIQAFKWTEWEMPVEKSTSAVVAESADICLSDARLGTSE